MRPGNEASSFDVGGVRGIYESEGGQSKRTFKSGVAVQG